MSLPSQPPITMVQTSVVTLVTWWGLSVMDRQRPAIFSFPKFRDATATLKLDVAFFK
jgi:hypothetical protein